MKIKTVTVKEIQKLDHVAINVVGIPSLSLMENAGRLVAVEVLKTLKKNARVCVVCGLGNNAGDGFVIARYLINAGVKVEVYLIGKGSKLKKDALVNYKILKKLKYKIHELKESQSIPPRSLNAPNVVVDALFGVGLNRELKGLFKRAVDHINSHAKAVVSVDTPSGLDATTGHVLGTCIKAKKTVTFSFAKSGFFRNKGPKMTGKIVVVNIGIPKKLINQIIG